MNHYCSGSGSKWFATAQTRAPNESLLHRLGLQMNHYCSDSGSKWFTTAQTQAPNDSLLLRLGLLMNHYCTDSGYKWITTEQTQATNDSLLLRLRLQMIRYCSDSGSKLHYWRKFCAGDVDKLQHVNMSAVWMHFTVTKNNGREYVQFIRVKYQEATCCWLTITTGSIDHLRTQHHK